MTLLIFSCENLEKEYKHQSELFIESYNSLDFENIESIYNKKKIGKTNELLDKLIDLNSDSNEKYFFDLLRFRLLLIEGKYEKALISLESIRKINPMMFYFYKATTYELVEDSENSLKYYNLSLSKCGDSNYCTLIEFLMSNNFERFINKLESKNPQAYYFVKKLKDELNKSENEIRKQFFNNVFTNYIIPNLS
jgi:tetratricopeptide (TPR) repeat protein